jgi:hypothetical protein
MDLHIRKVADKMGGKRGAGQFRTRIYYLVLSSFLSRSSDILSIGILKDMLV